MRYYAVDMPDGKRYGVPAELIAKNYADYYASHDENYQENFDAMMEWFDTNDFEFADWAKNNMNWNEVKNDAVILAKNDEPSCDYEEGWMNGKYHYEVTEND